MAERERDVTGMKELQALLGSGTEFEGKLTCEVSFTAMVADPPANA